MCRILVGGPLRLFVWDDLERRWEEVRATLLAYQEVHGSGAWCVREAAGGAVAREEVWG